MSFNKETMSFNEPRVRGHSFQRPCMCCTIEAAEISYHCFSGRA
eukprot:SAG11_NODE_25330_length_360_cov_0.796935_1_plen_43_part_10